MRASARVRQGITYGIAKNTLRRVPQQARSRARFEGLLDAAEALLEEGGYEAATTNAIAERAGTSIGALYGFFPNRDALLGALAARYSDGLRANLEGVLIPEVLRLPLPELVGRIVDAFVALHEQHRGFRSVFAGSMASPQLAAASEELHREVLERVEALIRHRLPHLDRAHLSLYTSICVQAAKALLLLAENTDASGRAQVLEETKALLTAYLEDVSRRR